ncbi:MULTISPECIES: 5-formyltetrahydrofolate cyclo-ligase [Halanaerobium]|uniref:5-formyltetrahydrofolate cyclo-ligase n=1 Tax=Halanaerobium saccharolyticum TaxID=43595 RepID=A0A4R6S5Z4_9FIRM|nr:MULTISPECIES: 5-formyltetrahydrofolate cyclo-ligase [Halanaerobium]PUU91833.1 MAG: 5-formyltetrahydrofolate cyclo-ligase [Halanaerobium sp.]PUU92017.1 MAG: 5-formyltetrahydrofolate cyclo-ligase [Halanaerobium sp.]TDP94763.1 5-formyltetrahydrofolate cyclo-ligase [Halanaerobium saccharolyticum]
MQKKEELRKKYLKERSEIPQNKISSWSQKINKQFLKLPQLETAKKVMAYASMRKEIETFDLMEELLDQGYLLYLPYTRKDQIDLGTAQINNLDSDLKEGVYGVQEPVARIRGEEVPEDLDLIIVPGACFTPEGYRIGYGGGYYDSFLSKHADGALKVGFCYDRFIVDSIPVEDHDVPVDLIITEKEVIRTKQ